MQLKWWENRQREEIPFKAMNYKLKQETTKPKNSNHDNQCLPEDYCGLLGHNFFSSLLFLFRIR